MSVNGVNLKTEFQHLIEMRFVLEKTEQFFMNDEIPEEFGSGNLNFVAGVVNRSRAPGFERMLWRVSRGNVFIRRADIEEPFADPKTVYILLFDKDRQIEDVEFSRVKICTRPFLWRSFKGSS